MKVVVFCYLDNNLGDDLMIEILAEKYKNVDFYIYSSKTIVKKTFEKYANIIVRDDKYKNSDLKDADLILSLGGSIFIVNSIYSIASRIYKIIRLGLAKLRGKPIITLGCNFGPFNFIGKYLIYIEILLNNKIVARDTEFSDVFKSSKISYSNDIVYSFNSSFNSSFKRFLGISAYRNLSSNESNVENYLGLAKLADKYIEETGMGVKIFAFDSENENDLSAAHHIFRNIKNKDKSEIIPYTGDSILFLNEFNTCSKFLSIRFHSAVIADLLKIDFYPFYYSNKMKSYIGENFSYFKIEPLQNLNSNDNYINSLFDRIMKNEICRPDGLRKDTSKYFEILDEFFIFNKSREGTST